jgi:hypothetical protein
MGLTVGSPNGSPPRLTPRRLSETNAATTLAFFKQQSPLEPYPPTAPSSQPTPVSSGVGSVGGFRKKQKYTIKNIEAWGERHGRPATYDPAGRALWKRPSDGHLVYLGCPAPGCGKTDFVTLHGFMCHLTKKHKDRSLGNQTRALDICGIVFDPNSPLPQRPSRNSPSGSIRTDAEGSQHEPDDSSVSYSDDDRDHSYTVVKAEEPGKPQSPPRPNGSIKPTISSMIDGHVEQKPHHRGFAINGSGPPPQRNGASGYEMESTTSS